MTSKQQPKVQGVNAWRKERGLTVVQLASRLGLTPGALSALLYKTSNPGVSTATRVAQALGVPLEQISWDERASELPTIPERVPGTGVTPEQWQVARAWLQAGRSKSEVVRALGIGRQTLYNLLERGS